jgi:hypothetical protein
MTSQLQMVNELVRKLEAEKFFGQLTFQFRRGQIEIIREEKTTKLFQGDTQNGRNNF